MTFTARGSAPSANVVTAFSDFDYNEHTHVSMCSHAQASVWTHCDGP